MPLPFYGGTDTVISFVMMCVCVCVCVDGFVPLIGMNIETWRSTSPRHRFDTDFGFKRSGVTQTVETSTSNSLDLFGHINK